MSMVPVVKSMMLLVPRHFQQTTEHGDNNDNTQPGSQTRR